MTFILTFLGSFLLVVSLMPQVMRIARRRGWYDSVSERKIHTGSIPRLGGVGIALGFFISLPAACLLIGALRPGAITVDWHMVSLLAIGVGYNALGLVDDFRNLKAKLKLAIQIVLAIAIILSGYSFHIIEIPVAPYRVDLGILGPILTFIWIIGITNALNLIDGMDGLAGGISLIACAVWAALYLKTGQLMPALIALAAVGSTLGFLFYNFPPAGIFMGDSGSMLLGFFLAVFPLLGGSGERMETGLLPAITVCVIPIFDTFAAILRRWRQGVSFFTADKFHFHHKLLNLGLTARQILAIVYSLCGLLGLSVLSAVYVSPDLSFWLMLSGWAIILLVFMILHFLKEKNIKIAPRGR